MRRGHHYFLVCVLTAVFLTLGCGGTQYDDMDKALETEIDVMTKFVSQMGKAGDAEAVAAAIRTYASEMETLVPQLKAIAEKYPKFKPRADLPEKLKTKIAQVEKLSQQMQKAIMKASRYMMSQEVQKAWQEYGRVMNKLQEKS